MTHATVALGSGDLRGAFGAHPLFPLVLLIVIWGGVQLARGRRLTVAGRELPLPALLAVIAAIWVARLSIGR
jgi:hypothetical protein